MRGKLYQKIIAPVIALMLTFVFVLESSADSAVMAEMDYTYVSAVQLFSGSTYEAALNECRKAGFIPQEGNLKEGTTASPLVLGYQTTKRRDQAITKISMLQMCNGYEAYDYSTVVDQQAKSMLPLAEELFSCADEMRDNLAKGSPSAAAAYRMLNYFYVDEEDMLLGDYLLSDQRDAEFLTRMMTRSSVSFVTALYSAMLGAVADYNPDEQFEPQEYVVTAAETVPVDLGDEPSILPWENAEAEEVVTTSATETTASTIETTTTSTEEVTETTSDVTTEAEQTTMFSDETTALPIETTDTAEFAETTTAAATTTEETTAALTSAEVVVKCSPTYNNWASRISRTGIVELLDADELTAEYDAVYYDAAVKLRRIVQVFAADYEDAAARTAEKGAESAISEEANAISDVEDVHALVMEQPADEENADLGVLLAYNILSDYRYNNQMSVAEYLVKAGKQTYAAKNDYQMLYPLVAAMTRGQVTATQLNGLPMSIMNLCSDPDAAKIEQERNDAFQSFEDAIHDYNGQKYISVWEGVDQSIFEKQVAVTSEAISGERAGKEHEFLMKRTTVAEDVNHVFEVANNIMVYVFAVVSVVNLAMAILPCSASAITFSLWMGLITSGSALGIIGGAIGCILWAAGYIGLIALAAMLVWKIVEMIFFSDEELSDKVSYEPPPEGIFDSVEDDTYWLYYQAVSAPSKDNDLNFGKGKDKRWNVLYYTKEEKAGSPLCLDENGNVFRVQKGSVSVPSGYTPLCCFNRPTAANLNSYLSQSTRYDTYLFYRTEANANVTINEGTEAKSAEQLYVKSVKLMPGRSPEEAKTALQMENYTALDTAISDLLTNRGTEHLYFGYQTTTNPKEAVTDIRVMSQSAEKQMMFGKGTYSSAGTSQTGDTLYFTKLECMGSPILADFLVTEDAKTIPEGYEPVNLFGGLPYNFNLPRREPLDRGTEEYSKAEAEKKDDDDLIPLPKRFIYFRPSVEYTSHSEDGASEQYLGGLTLVVGRSYYRHYTESGKNSVRNYANLLADSVNGKVVPLHLNDDVLMTDDHTFGDITDMNYWENPHDMPMESYLIYTTTYNPKRALYDIRSYTAAPQVESLPVFLGNYKNESSNGAYAACSVCYDLYHFYMNTHYHLLGYSSTHDYLNTTLGASDELYDLRENMLPEDFEQTGEEASNVSWAASTLRCKNLYLLGAGSGLTPLRASDVLVLPLPFEKSTAADTALYALDGTAVTSEGFVSVQDVRTPNRTEPHNLAYASKKKSTYGCYLYLRKQVTEKPYIKSVYVASYSASDNAAAQGMEWAKLDKDMVKMLEKPSEMACISKLAMQCTDEVWPCNFASETPWQKDWKNYLTDNSSYVGVSRTSVQGEAITDIIKYDAANGLAADSVKIDGVNYERCGDMIKDTDGNSYYLYATRNQGAGTGRPITDIDFSALPIVGSASTVLEYRKENGEGVYHAKKNCGLYLHTYADDSKSYMEALYLGHGATLEDALCDLLEMNCTCALPCNLNKDPNDECVVLGFSKYNPLSKDTTGTQAIKDIFYTIDQPPQDEMKVDGILYKRARDIYYMNDLEGAVTINSEHPIYIYYTTKNTTKVKQKFPNTICGLGVAEGDRIPDKLSGSVWENILTLGGNRMNLGESIVAYEYDPRTDRASDLIDTRLYLYANRKGDKTKEGAEITGGHCEAASQYGNVLVSP